MFVAVLDIMWEGAVISDQDQGALVGAVRWIELLLTGAIGTSVAILAIASIGFLMLNGRLPLRRGASVILGCFILFSSAAIAQGITSAAPQPMVVPVVAAVASTPIKTPAPAPYDPYAFASVPSGARGAQDLFQPHP